MKTRMTHTITVSTDMSTWSYEQIAEYQRVWREIIKDLDYDVEVKTTLEEHTPAGHDPYSDCRG
jgi:hypothetical protein